MENGLLKKRASEHIEVAKKLMGDASLSSLVDAAAAKIVDCYLLGGKTIFFGNGGSSADAQHMAAEFLGRYLKERRALPSIALTANSSAMTAISNDYGYDHTFRRQLEAWGKKGDVAIGISTSGNSKNVVEAAKHARANGIFMISFVGKNKCELDSLSDICIKVPSAETPRIQEMHELILHTICEMVENELISKKAI
jgi:D-sedoheptulose 7-phosphate isomerase